MFEEIAYAAPQGTPAEVNPVMGFMPLVLLMVIFYFLLIRPQQKRQKQLQKTIESLKKGDRVITAGGILGIITSLQDDYVVIKTGDGDSKMEILKSGITGLREDKAKS